MKRVVITGVGAITPLGKSFMESWDAVLFGRSGISEISRFDASGLPWQVAGEIRDFDAGQYLGPKEIRRLDLFAQYGAAAASMAAADAGLMEDNGRVNSAFREGGIMVGSSRGGIGTIERSLSAGGKRPRRSPYLMPATTISMAASYAAVKLGMYGHCLGISNACSSGANAIGEAYRLIKTGYAGLMIAGGTDAPLCRLCIEGYGTAGALSTGSGSDACRPFDRSRDGFVLSEGACMLVLEELESAEKRGADIYGELTGYGNNVDAFDQTRPDPSGEAGALLAAMKEAVLSPDEIGYINTHGTSTLLGDAAESAAIRQVFGSRSGKIPCSAIKSMTGHMIAASGAFEAACTVMTLKLGIIPPSINLFHQDPACGLRLITERTVSSAETALTSSFGFGGVNAVLALRRYSGQQH